MSSIKWYGWRPDVPDYRDHVHIPTLQMATPIKHLFNPAFLPHVRNQGEQGSCTGHMAYGIAAYLHLREHQNVHAANLSPRFAYWNARKLEGTTKDDSGAEIRDAIKGVVKWGISTEDFCNYDPRTWDMEPTAKAYADAKTEIITEYARVPRNLAFMKQTLFNGDPIGLGISCYENMDSDAVTATGILTMPEGSLQGGHAIWLCGYNDKLVYPYKKMKRVGAFLCMNSWGTDWGCKPEGYPTRGFFWLPYGYITDANLSDDFWVCRKIT